MSVSSVSDRPHCQERCDRHRRTTQVPGARKQSLLCCFVARIPDRYETEENRGGAVTDFSHWSSWLIIVFTGLTPGSWSRGARHHQWRPVLAETVPWKNVRMLYFIYYFFPPTPLPPHHHHHHHRSDSSHYCRTADNVVNDLHSVHSTRWQQIQSEQRACSPATGRRHLPLAAFPGTEWKNHIGILFN